MAQTGHKEFNKILSIKRLYIQDVKKTAIKFIDHTKHCPSSIFYISTMLLFHLSIGLYIALKSSQDCALYGLRLSGAKSANSLQESFLISWQRLI
jgi:hypothetical protein